MVRLGESLREKWLNCMTKQKCLIMRDKGLNIKFVQTFHIWAKENALNRKDILQRILIFVC